MLTIPGFRLCSKRVMSQTESGLQVHGHATCSYGQMRLQRMQCSFSTKAEGKYLVQRGLQPYLYGGPFTGGSFMASGNDSNHVTSCASQPTNWSHDQMSFCPAGNTCLMQFIYLFTTMRILGAVSAPTLDINRSMRASFWVQGGRKQASG